MSIPGATAPGRVALLLFLVGSLLAGCSGSEFSGGSGGAGGAGGATSGATTTGSVGTTSTTGVASSGSSDPSTGTSSGTSGDGGSGTTSSGEGGASATGTSGSGGDGGSGGAGSTGSSVGEPPVPVINHPSDGQERPADQIVPFVGVATDAEDGDLGGNDMVWSSDLDGILGTGREFDEFLSAGTHLITLQATDSDGNVAAATIDLIME